MRLLTEFEKELAVAYTKVVAISVDPVQINAAFRAGLGARFPILSDAERVYQRGLEMVEIADRKHDPFLPYDFVLYPDLTIYKIYNGYYFWGRATIEELRQDFRAISKEIRWDYDPSTLTPEMFKKPAGVG
ncbi:MAG: hypothetical protein HY331_16105 [Chloroflexi bacterium]|nr:hypothetical protein [Chloroflexota bacterium]